MSQGQRLANRTGKAHGLFTKQGHSNYTVPIGMHGGLVADGWQLVERYEPEPKRLPFGQWRLERVFAADAADQHATRAFHTRVEFERQDGNVTVKHALKSVKFGGTSTPVLVAVVRRKPWK
jgi:hypothetical protein